MPKTAKWVTCLSLLLTTTIQAEENEFAGVWFGHLNLPNGQTLRMGVEVDARPDGSLLADLISIDQGAGGLPSRQVTVEGRLVTFEFRSPTVFVTGELSPDGDRILAEYRQGTFRADLPLERVERLPGFVHRWQNPVRPYPYVDEEVRFPGGAADVSLAGTITVPRGPGPHPAVVLVTGSGPQGRDELIGYHRPFLVLADHFTRHGFTVLRYDDRGVGMSTGSFDEATTADLATDARAAWSYLRTRTYVDRDRIWIVGHSEGGMIAPMVAVEESDLTGIVLLAGPGIPIIDLMDMQYRLFSLAAGASAERADAIARMYRVIHEVLIAETDRIAIYTAIQAHFDALSEEESTALGWSRSDLNGVIESLLTPWWRYFIPFNPVDYLSRVQVPMLAVNGDADLNVTARENLAGIEQAAALAGNPDVTVIEYAGLNHMLNRTETAAADDSLALGETINPVVLRDVTRWLQVRAGLAVTAVELDDSPAPSAFTMAPNYPNPFNGTTHIQFDLPRDGRWSLSVFDLAGQRIRVLDRGEGTAGRHRVVWDGTDDRRRPVASGVYLLELRMGSLVRRQALTLLR